MDTIIKILNAMGTVVPLLLGTGFLVKYLPFLKKGANELIPLLNALVAFLGLFGASTAHASLLGDIGKVLTLPGQALVSVFLSIGTSWIYEHVLKGFLPPGNYPLPPPAK